MPRDSLKSFIAEELASYHGGELSSCISSGPELCLRCRNIFSEDFAWGQSDDQFITLRWDDDVTCTLCALLHEEFVLPNRRLGQYEAIDIRYWLEKRDGWLFAIHNINFALFEDTTPPQRPLRLALQPQWKQDSSNPRIPQFTTDLGTSTGSPEGIRQSQSWLHQCTSKHKVCHEIQSSLNFVPRRLVQISGPKGQPSLRVADTYQWKRRPIRPYATLSHCWGNSVQCKLLMSNVDRYSKELPVTELSPVFKDAIFVAQELGIQYLWIDSLCIIQDSKKDWARESTQMGTIYKKSLINIAATGFKDGSIGIFSRRNPSTILPMELMIENDIDKVDDTRSYRQKELNKGRYYLFNVDSYSKGVDNGPLNQRGWVVLERALSLRTLHFGSKQLFWECAELEASDVFPSGFKRGMPTDSPKLFIRNKSDYDPLMDPNARGGHHSNGPSFIVEKSLQGPSLIKSPGLGLDIQTISAHGMMAAHIRWVQIVQKYSSCDLTFSNDKLVAIAGLAKDVNQDIDCPYYAGLWLIGMIHQLCWRVSQARPAPKRSGVRGPTWSWASVDGPIAIKHWPRSKQKEEEPSRGDKGHAKLHARLLHVSVRPTGTDMFGQIHSGEVTITGLLSVLHVGKPGESDPLPNPSSGILVETRRQARLNWDSTDLEDRFITSGDTFIWRYSTYGSNSSKKKKNKATLGPSDVFFLPIRVMEEADGHEWEEDMLTGLLLLPTKQAKGQYQRVGLLRISNFWWEGGITPFLNPTKIWFPELYREVEKECQYTITIV